MNRAQLIEELMALIKAETYAEANEALARATLNSYSTDLLAKLHDGATASIITEMTSDYMRANEGKSESWMSLFHHVRDTCYNHDGKLCCSPRTAVNSLSQYPAMSKDPITYYKQATALTSTVIEVQDALMEHHPEVEKRLLSYTTAEDKNIELLVRLTNYRLVNFILDHTDRWAEVAAVMIERHTDDVDLISSIIDSQHSRALSTGTL